MKSSYFQDSRENSFNFGYDTKFERKNLSPNLNNTINNNNNNNNNEIFPGEFIQTSKEINYSIKKNSFPLQSQTNSPLNGIQFPLTSSILWDRTPISSPFNIFCHEMLPELLLSYQDIKNIITVLLYKDFETENSYNIPLYLSSYNNLSNFHKNLSKFEPLPPSKYPYYFITNLSSEYSDISLQLPFFKNNFINSINDLKKNLLTNIISSKKFNIKNFFRLQGKGIASTTGGKSGIPISNHSTIYIEALLPKFSFQLVEISPLSISSTPLYNLITKNLSTNEGISSNKIPNVGYITLNQNRHQVFLLENDPAVKILPTVGVWVDLQFLDYSPSYDNQSHLLKTSNTIKYPSFSNFDSNLLYHPLVWAACIRFILSDIPKDKIYINNTTFLLTIVSLDLSKKTIIKCFEVSLLDGKLFYQNPYEDVEFLTMNFTTDFCVEDQVSFSTVPSNELFVSHESLSDSLRCKFKALTNKIRRSSSKSLSPSSQSSVTNSNLHVTINPNYKYERNNNNNNNSNNSNEEISNLTVLSLTGNYFESLNNVTQDNKISSNNSINTNNTNNIKQNISYSFPAEIISQQQQQLVSLQNKIIELEKHVYTLKKELDTTQNNNNDNNINNNPTIDTSKPIKKNLYNIKEKINIKLNNKNNNKLKKDKKIIDNIKDNNNNIINDDISNQSFEEFSEISLKKLEEINKERLIEEEQYKLKEEEFINEIDTKLSLTKDNILNNIDDEISYIKNDEKMNFYEENINIEEPNILNDNELNDTNINLDKEYLDNINMKINEKDLDIIEEYSIHESDPILQQYNKDDSIHSNISKEEYFKDIERILNSENFELNDEFLNQIDTKLSNEFLNDNEFNSNDINLFDNEILNINNNKDNNNELKSEFSFKDIENLLNNDNNFVLNDKLLNEINIKLNNEFYNDLDIKQYNKLLQENPIPDDNNNLINLLNENDIEQYNNNNYELNKEYLENIELKLNEKDLDLNEEYLLNNGNNNITNDYNLNNLKHFKQLENILNNENFELNDEFLNQIDNKLNDEFLNDNYFHNNNIFNTNINELEENYIKNPKDIDNIINEYNFNNQNYKKSIKNYSKYQKSKLNL